MFRYLTRRNPHFGLFLAVSPLRALCAVVLAGALGAAIDYAGGGELAQAGRYALAFGLFILLDLLVDMLDQYARFQALRRAMTSLKRDLVGRLMSMSLPRFREKAVSDYISGLTADTELVRENYFRTLLGMYADGICGAAALGALLWMSPLLGLYVLAVSLAQSLVPAVFSRRLEAAGERYSAAQERRMGALKGTLSAFLTAKVFRLEDTLARRCGREEDRAEDSFRRLELTREWSNSVSYVFNQVSLLGVFLLGAVLHLRGTVTLPQVVAASQLISYISDPVLWLNADIADLKTVRAPIRKLLAILSEPADTGGPRALPRPAGDLELRDLTFSYGDAPLLDRVSCVFRPGGKYLITGPSGGGKSTLLAILAGLRADYGGTVLLGGADLRELDRASVTASLCCLDQEPYLFDDTLYNNVALFADPGEAAVTDALVRAGLGDRLASPDLGLRTPLGENGLALSGGERQRVVLARALLRNSPILLLDESTSHLDPASAAAIERTVLTLPDVTVLLVTHNATPAALSLADQTLELRNGKLTPLT